MSTIGPINRINLDIYNQYNNQNASSDSNLEAAVSAEEKDEYIKSSKTSCLPDIQALVSAAYDPNDKSFGISYADKNSKIIPTINGSSSESSSSSAPNIMDTTRSETMIHTDTDGTRFLVVRTTVGEQTFEKSIKLSETL